jgi:hypothetical protein
LPLSELPSSAGGGVAEGRGGVVKLSSTTDLVSNLQTTRGMGIRVMRFENRAVFESLELTLKFNPDRAAGNSKG